MFAFVRAHESERVAVLANFSEASQAIATYRLRLQGIGMESTNLLNGRWVDGVELKLDGLELMVLSLSRLLP